MTSTSETGHAKNVANLDVLISSVIGYGEAYKPSNVSIQVTALQNLSADAKDALRAVNAAMPSYNIAVAAREIAFDPLAKLSTRILNSLKATDTPSPQYKQVSKLAFKAVKA